MMAEAAETSRRRFGLWAALGVAAAVGLANLAKPVHIDDTVYLSIARWIVHHPLDPFGGPINWQEIPEPSYKISTNPPGLSYYFALVIRIGGEDLRLLHASMIPWLLLASWASYRLGERWAGSGLMTALLVLVSPAVVVGTNLMLDVPLLSCLLASVEWMERSCEGRRTALAMLASAGFGAIAVFIKVPGLALVPIALAQAWRWRSVRPLVAALGPIIATGAWQVASRSLYGSTQIGEGLSFLATLRSMDFWSVAERTLTMMAILGSTFPVWIACPWKGNRAKWAAASALLAGVLAASRYPPTLWLKPPIPVVAFVVAVVFGALGLVSAIGRPAREEKDLPHRGPGIVLAAWIASVSFLVIVFGPFVAVRSFLPIEAPLAIALLRGHAPRLRSRVGVGLAIVGMASLSMLLAVVDTRWAGCYPEFAAKVARRYEGTGREVYFLGHWGWQYYAEREGLRGWDARWTDVPPGSLVIIPLRVDKQQISPAVLDRLRKLDQIVIPPNPLRLTTWDGVARFYGGFYGQLPWSIETGPTEEFYVLEAGPRGPAR
jgi:hypothetical protein